MKVVLSVIVCVLVSLRAHGTSTEDVVLVEYIPFQSFHPGYMTGGDDCRFTECCKEKATSVISQCYTIGPLLSALLSLAIFVKLTSSSDATVCTTTTLEMSTTTGTIQRFVTVTSTSTTVSTTLQVFPVTSVLLATAVLARTIEVLETAPLVYTTITVTSEVITTRTVATIQIAEPRCKLKNAKRALEEFDNLMLETENSEPAMYRDEVAAPWLERTQPAQTKLYTANEDSWFPYLDDSGFSASPVATRTPVPSSSTIGLQPSFTF